MAIHQSDLHSSREDRELLDREAIRAYLEDEVDLGDGLALSDEVMDGLRRQAMALYENGKWKRCAQLILGLIALGRVHPTDAIMLSRCYRELDMPMAARQCRDHAERIMSAMGIVIDFREEEA